MSMIFSRLLRMAAHRIAFSPQARDAAARAAQGLAAEARLIARDKDRARAAGRSVRRMLNGLQGGRDGR